MLLFLESLWKNVCLNLDPDKEKSLINGTDSNPINKIPESRSTTKINTTLTIQQ
jgi:hypothetical protein